jgi:hypothetical protein
MKKSASNMSDPSQLEKLVKLLAKKVEDFQNYVGIDAPHDAGIDTLESEIESLKNPKITKFWKNLSSKQQGELHSMVTTYLYNKAVKEDPDYFDGETPQKIVYKLSQKTKAPAGGTAGGMAKLVKFLAKESENYMNNLGLDSPEYIEFYQIEDVIDNIKDPKIKKIWNSMKSPQQEDLYDKIVAVLKKKYGSEDEYDDMLENKLNEIQTRITEGSIHTGGFVTPETDADWAALRRREKGDDDGPNVAPTMVGVTFFNVPAGKEDTARTAGLKQFKSGKWGYKHFSRSQTTDDVRVLKAAEKEFGKGRYWQPNS